MGHAYVKNLNDILMRKIYAHGKISINELIEWCIENKEWLHASEGDYKDKSMLSYAFEELVLFHSHKWNQNNHRPNIEPIPENEEQIEMIKEFMKNGISEKLSEYYDENDDCYIRKFDDIKWKFTPGTRKMYIDKTIPAMHHLEN